MRVGEQWTHVGPTPPEPRKKDGDQEPDRPERDRNDDEAPETPSTQPDPVPVEGPPDAPDKPGPYVLASCMARGAVVERHVPYLVRPQPTDEHVHQIDVCRTATTALLEQFSCCARYLTC